MNDQSVKDLIDLITVIKERGIEIERAAASLNTNKSKRHDALLKLAKIVDVDPGQSPQIDSWKVNEIVSAAEARVGRFYLYEFNRETKESAKAKDR